MQFTSDSSLLFKPSFKGNPVSPVSEHLISSTHTVSSQVSDGCLDFWTPADGGDLIGMRWRFQHSLADWWTYVEHIRIIMTKIKPKQYSNRNNHYISMINMWYVCINYLISIVKSVCISSTWYDWFNSTYYIHRAVCLKIFCTHSWLNMVGFGRSHKF